MPRNHKRSSPLITRKTIYWAVSVALVCYLLHLSTEVRTLSSFVEAEPNEVYYLLKEPINLLLLHPKTVEIQILDRRSQMTLDFVDFYMTENLALGNSTTLVHLTANPIERKIILEVKTFLNLLKIHIEWNIYAVNKGLKPYTQIEEEIRVGCPMFVKYFIGDMLHQTHIIMMNRIQDKYSSELDIALL